MRRSPGCSSTIHTCRRRRRHTSPRCTCRSRAGAHPSPAGPPGSPATRTSSAAHAGCTATHALRSKSMNSRMASCAVIAPAGHSAGNVLPVDHVPSASTFSACQSLNTTRPRLFDGAPTGVLNVECSGVVPPQYSHCCVGATTPRRVVEHRRDGRRAWRCRCRSGHCWNSGPWGARRVEPGALGAGVADAAPARGQGKPRWWRASYSVVAAEDAPASFGVRLERRDGRRPTRSAGSPCTRATHHVVCC